jgi:hypothetical protein
MFPDMGINDVSIETGIGDNGKGLILHDFTKKRCNKPPGSALIHKGLPESITHVHKKVIGTHGDFPNKIRSCLATAVTKRRVNNTIVQRCTLCIAQMKNIAEF